MSSNPPSVNTIVSQLQTLKKSGSKLEIGCSGKLRSFLSKIKEKLDAENFIYSEEDLLNGVRTVFLQREKLKRPKIDPNDKRVQCPNGVLQFIGPFSTISATGEPNQAEQRLGEINKWGDQQMGEIIDDMMAELNNLIKQLAEIGFDANIEAIMSQIPGLKGKPLNMLLQILQDYLDKGKKKVSVFDQQFSATKGAGAKPGGGPSSSATGGG